MTPRDDDHASAAGSGAPAAVCYVCRKVFPTRADLEVHAVTRGHFVSSAKSPSPVPDSNAPPATAPRSDDARRNSQPDGAHRDFHHHADDDVRNDDDHDAPALDDDADDDGAPADGDRFFVNPSPPPFADDEALSAVLNVQNPELYSEYDLRVEHERVEAELKDVTEMIREKLNAHVDLVEAHLTRSEQPLAPLLEDGGGAGGGGDGVMDLAASLSQSLQRELHTRDKQLERADAEIVRLQAKAKSEASVHDEVAQLVSRLAAADAAFAEVAAERSAALVRAHRAEDDTTTAQRELTLEKRSNRLRQEQLKRVSAELETIRGRMLEAEHMAELRQTQLVELLDKDSSTATQVAVLSRQLKASNDSLAAAEQRVVDLQKRLKVAEIDAADAQAEVAKMQHYADEERGGGGARRQRARETSPTAVQAMAMEIERDRAERAEQHVAELEAAAAETAASVEQQSSELRAARDETAALAKKLREAAALVRRQSELLSRAKAELDEQRELEHDVREDLTAQTRHIELMHEELEALERQRDEARAAYDEQLAAHASQDDELRGELDTAHSEIESLRAQLDAVSSGLARAVNLCTQQRATIESQREGEARSERAASLAAEERSREIVALQASLTAANGEARKRGDAQRAAEQRADALAADLAQHDSEAQRAIEKARSALNAQQQEASGQVHRLLTERDTLTAEVQRLTGVAHGAESAVEAAQEYTKKAEAMVAKLVKDMRLAHTAYERLSASQATVQGERDALLRDRDLIRGERDTLLAERDQLLVELEAAATAASEAVAMHVRRVDTPPPAAATAAAPATTASATTAAPLTPARPKEHAKTATPGVRLQPIVSIPAIRTPAGRARSALRATFAAPHELNKSGSSDALHDNDLGDLDSLHDEFDDGAAAAAVVAGGGGHAHDDDDGDILLEDGANGGVSRGADAARVKALLQRYKQANSRIEQQQRAIERLRAAAAASSMARRRATAATPTAGGGVVPATPGSNLASGGGGTYWQERLNAIRDNLEREVNARLASVGSSMPTTPVRSTPFMTPMAGNNARNPTTLNTM